MLDRKLWVPAADGPVFSLPNGVVEDFYVCKARPEIGGYVAYYCHGPSFQDMRLYGALGETPLGPWRDGPPIELYPSLDAHTRLYRANINAEQDLISAVWPGLPQCGIWLFSDRHLGDRKILDKQLFIGPKEGTCYSVVAANPCTLRAEDGTWDIFFEGRNENMFWRLFHATWDGHGKPVVDDEPLCDGANPSLARFDGVTYLYYSKLRPGGRFAFATWALKQ